MKLQLKTWDSADHPHVITLRRVGPRRPLSLAPERFVTGYLNGVPSILHTNRDSREVGVKNYHLCFGAIDRKPKYVNFDRDIFATIEGEDWWHDAYSGTPLPPVPNGILSFAPSMTGPNAIIEDLRRVRKLALIQREPLTDFGYRTALKWLNLDHCLETLILPHNAGCDPLEFSRQLKDNAVQEVIQVCADEALARSLPGDESSEGMLMRVPDVVFVNPGTMG